MYAAFAELTLLAGAKGFAETTAAAIAVSARLNFILKILWIRKGEQNQKNKKYCVSVKSLHHITIS